MAVPAQSSHPVPSTRAVATTRLRLVAAAAQHRPAKSASEWRPRRPDLSPCSRSPASSRPCCRAVNDAGCNALSPTFARISATRSSRDRPRQNRAAAESHRCSKWPRRGNSFCLSWAFLAIQKRIAGLLLVEHVADFRVACADLFTFRVTGEEVLESDLRLLAAPSRPSCRCALRSNQI